MKVVNDSPKVYTIDNFLTPSECQHFINISRNHIKPALVSGDKEGFVSNGRTGQNHWVLHNTDNITKKIGEKIAEQVGIPLENAEAYQIIYYDKTQEYRQHYDGWLFDGSEKSRRNMKYGGQRMKTALVYLNNVEAGGGTKFTKLNLEVNAEKGKLLVFENVHSGTNKRHELSEHAGMPVIEGEKWAFNLWFREESRQKLYDYNKGAGAPLKPPEEVSQDKIEQVSHSNISVLDNLNFSIDKGVPPLKPLEGVSPSGVSPSNEIKTHQKFLSSDDMLKIIMNCYFEEKERATAWVNKERIPEIIKKIEELVKIDSAYFESMCVTKYAPKVVHRDHQDAYDLTTAKGRENTSQTGQRLMTITGFLSETKVTFPKLGKQFNMCKGDLLVYNNCYNESDKRNENMIKNYAPEGVINLGVEGVSPSGVSPSSMLLFNIYVREKSRTKGGILKIANGIIESKIEEKQEIKCNLSNEELINMIYTRNPFENLRIPGFKLTNKAPIDYVVDTLLKIKNLRDNSNSGFLNPVNLEKEYFIDEYNPVTVEDVINPEIHKIVDEYFKINIKNGVYPFGDRQSQRYKIIDEIMTRLLHLEFLPLIEKIVGKKMEATYTYISAYVKGADLPPHTDRPDCEFTCSYIIGKPPDTNWNIYLHKTKQPEKYLGRYDFTPPKEECLAVDCRENGLMIFNGTDHIHYREPLEHEYYNVVLLHYKGTTSL